MFVRLLTTVKPTSLTILNVGLHNRRRPPGYTGRASDSEIRQPTAPLWAIQNVLLYCIVYWTLMSKSARMTTISHR